MSRFLRLMALAVPAICMMSSFATVTRASLLGDIMQNGLNGFEDQDREALWDNGDGVFDVGDVLFGFVRIDDHNPGTGSVPNQIYAIFSQQVTSLGAGGVINYGSTTVAGLTLSDLIGTASPAGGVVAVFSSSTPIGNLINSSPGDVDLSGTTDIFDYFAAITGGLDLSLIAGFGTGATQGDDYLVSQDNGLSPFTPLAGAPNGGISAIPTTANVATFSAGFSILLNNDANVIYNEAVFSDLGTVHQLTVTNGAVRGQSGATNSAEWSDFDVAGVVGSGSNPGGFVTDADYFVNATVVPEPASILSWTGLLGAVALVGFKKRPVRKVC